MPSQAQRPLADERRLGVVARREAAAIAASRCPLADHKLICEITRPLGGASARWQRPLKELAWNVSVKKSIRRPTAPARCRSSS